MNPGATTRPSASIVRLAAAPAYLPTPTILPSCTATSAANAGSPEPSTTRPFLINRSYAMFFLLVAPLGPSLGPSRQPLSHRGFVTHHAPFERCETNATPWRAVQQHLLLDYRVDSPKINVREDA